MSLTSYQAAPPRVLGVIMQHRVPNATAKAPHMIYFAVERNLSFVKPKSASKNQPAKILVGTASWSDPGFVEHWYPKKMPAGDRLAWYAQHFEMVEVNSTFYAAPDARMVERWCRSTPDGFTFDVKLHQLLSRHSTNAKLLPPALQRGAETDAKGRVKLTPEIEQAMIEQFRRSIEILDGAGKLGALLLQLSPAFSPMMHKLSELDDLLGALGQYRIAIELRNRHWVEGEQLEATLDFLRAHSAAFVLVDAPAEKHFTIMPPDLNEITNPQLAYLRLQVGTRALHDGKTVASRFNYDSDAESRVAHDREWRKAKEVHVVFNKRARLRAACGFTDAGGARPNDCEDAAAIGVILGDARSVSRREAGENKRRAGDQTQSLAAAERLAPGASPDADDAAGHAPCDRARVGDWDVLRVHAALRAENIVVVRGSVAVQSKQDSGCHHRNASRCPPAVRAGDVFLAIQSGNVGVVRPRPATPRVPSRGAARLHGMDDVPYCRPADPGRIALSRFACGRRDLFRFAGRTLARAPEAPRNRLRPSAMVRGRRLRPGRRPRRCLVPPAVPYMGPGAAL